MPLFPLILTCFAFDNHEIRLEQRQLMQADDEGMVERFITLEGIKEPRMLSWAEERALRRDLVDKARSVLNGQWQRYRQDLVDFEDFWRIATPEDHKYLLRKMTTDEWEAQYQQTRQPQEWCKCGNKRVASCTKPHRIGGESYFGCYTCRLPIFGEERY